MKEPFGRLPSGETATLYTLSVGRISAAVTDYGATLVRLFVPDSEGNLADVVLGYDDCNGYRTANGACLGATIGRNANRLQGASFLLNGATVSLNANDGPNNLHSGPDHYHLRLWKTISYSDTSVTFALSSPDGDQGFPGNARIQVTYKLDPKGGLHIIYDAVSDQDTVFNLTNHSYFNLAGHNQTDKAMDQILTIPGRFFCPDDAQNIPTGELRNVAGTPMDFRKAKKIGNFEAFYARLNLKRNRGRTVITILSMVMSITVFVALQSFSGLLDASAAIKDSYLGDYSVTNETVGIAAASVDELHRNDMVDSLSTTMLTVYQFDESGTMLIDTDIFLQTWETLHIVGFDDERLTTTVSALSDGDKEDLRNGTACLVKNPIPFSVEGQSIENTELSVNDAIQVGGKTMRVVGIVTDPVTINNDGFTNGVQIIVCDAAYTAITGQARYAEVYPALTAGADTEQFEAWLNEWCSQNMGSHWLSYLQSDAELAESFAQIKMLCWGLILFIGLIGVLNIINTVYTNLHTRVSEIGMQRAIGMSKQSLYKTFLWEGAYYGLIASVVGGLIGYICSVFVEAAVNNTLQFGAVPIVSILEAAAVSIVACLIATAIPLRSIAKADIVKSIVAID